MDYENLKKKLEGCYVTVPTPFKDIKNLPINFDALKDYVEFLLGNGLNNETYRVYRFNVAKHFPVSYKILIFICHNDEFNL